MKRLLAIIPLALALPCLAFGQALTAQPPKPGPEVQKMAYFVGTWKAEGDVKANLFGPTGKSSKTTTCGWFAGGFHVVCRGDRTDPRGRFTKLTVFAYDAEAKVYTVYAITSRGETDSLKWTLTGNTWTSAWEAKVGGKPAKGRETEVQDSPTSYTFKVEYSVAGGPWTVLEEGKATKVK